MSELDLGNKFNFLRHTIKLQSVGRRTVLLGRGVCIGIGTSTRGPAMEPYWIIGGQASKVDQIYGSGPLSDGLEDALGEGVSLVGGIRVLGTGYATAELDVDDSQTPGVTAGTFSATGPGAWGNIPTITIEDGDLDGGKLETFNGDGTVGPYTLEFDDLVQSSVNYVTVAGVAKTIVYEGDPGASEVLMNTVTGELTFGTLVTTAQQIQTKYKYKSRKVTIQDEGGVAAHVYNNLMSLTMMSAKMRNDTICTFDPAPGMTHLPATMAATNMAGGSDGAEITIDDWEDAFKAAHEELPNEVIPSTVFSTDFEVTEGQGDIVALLSAYLNVRSKALKPCQGFVTFPATWTAEEMKDFKEGYSNLWMTLIGNGYSATERDLAPARAGQEAALPLGTSPATPTTSLQTTGSLLFQFTEAEREILTYAGVEVLVKDSGIHPYVGVSTDPDENFRRTVDVRTYANCIVFADNIVQQFMNERRTWTNMSRLKTSIEAVFEALHQDSVLDDFTVSVMPNSDDRNAVDIETMLQAVGHMERFNHTMSVGYWSDQVAA